ncbi:hypothetical protein F6X40_35505 [Paraburkholderia sp. UCT31]|uniref:hypothetical protein n=1 Tax=Paraburkholderia sp. UCT31 TaxID=2615209 RepID=UPI001655721F|nr:hypothetical protein [Paraburkholderia sp. UCT31]MBC8741857.1 hypothetical protein [Paraburkholderia sp. UCT31]
MGFQTQNFKLATKQALYAVFCGDTVRDDDIVMLWASPHNTADLDMTQPAAGLLATQLPGMVLRPELKGATYEEVCAAFDQAFRRRYSEAMRWKTYAQSKDIAGETRDYHPTTLRLLPFLETATR